MGAIGTKALAGIVPISNTWLSLGVRAAIAYFGGSIVEKATKSRALGDGFTIGGLAGVALDAFNSVSGGSASLGEYIAGSFATPSYPPGLTPRPGGTFNAGRPSVIRPAMGPVGGM